MSDLHFFSLLTVIAVLWILTLATWHSTYEHPSDDYPIEDATYFGGTE